ncbi:MAG: dihydroorotase [Archaeoglobales archaeon]|nr:dihydroorotase [Archaeoglobales archaeon]
MIYGKIFYRGEFIEAGIEVENGRIKKIGKLVKGKKVDGIILPAGIDVHVHFRDFEEKRKETIESGSLSALHGGICLVVDQPNTKPVVDRAEVYFRRMELAEKSTYVDYTLNLALTNKNVDKINEIVEKIREKYFLPAIGEVFLQNYNKEFEISYETLTMVSKINKKITIHAEDPRFVESGNPNFLFRKKEAEITAVEECEKIGEFHFCHLSTREAVERVKRGSFEVAPHHLLLSTGDYNRLRELVNVNPPLRQKDDADWLLRNFSKIQILASDHAPHTIEDKKTGSAGFPGVETTYPIFVYLAKRSLISFNDLVEKIAVNPAKTFGFNDYGEIEVGKFANFAIFDLRDVKKINSDKLHSLCNWTPYEGFKAVFPNQLYLRGEEVLESPLRSGIAF